jgi:CBS domain-containing protein
MRIDKVYRPGAVTCSATDPLSTVAQAMVAHNVGALPVLDGSMIVGIISERDLTRALAQQTDPTNATATTFASHDVQTAQPTDDTSEVARRMLDAGIRHLPVVQGKIVVGVISMRDLLAVETWL